MASRFVTIVAFFVVTGAAVWTIGEALRSNHNAGHAVAAVVAAGDVAAAEIGMYVGYAAAMTVAPRHPQARPRTRAAYAARRAYPGAPPLIPHAAGDPQRIADNCLTCHEHGGFAPALRAYAPVVPHPQLVNCRQCHVPAGDGAPFVASTFQPLPPPLVQQKAQPTGPNVMPHGTRMRENCTACHVGPAAVEGLRVTHPERSNCRQCHVPDDGGAAFSRAVTQ